jgi:hypothetical protein
MIGLHRYDNFNSSKYAADPYLPGAIGFNVMSQYPAFRFVVDRDINSILPEAGRIVQSTDDPSK